MDKEIKRFLSQGITFITPTRRLSRHLRFHYARSQIAAGHTVWQTPDCLPWSAWCRRIFESLSFYREDKPVLLNALQQQWLWQGVIRQSSDRDQLLQIDTVAKQVAHSYQLCQQWSLPIFPENVYLSEEARAFKAWVHAYEKIKQSEKLLDEACLGNFIIESIPDNPGRFGRLAFYGFELLSRQQQIVIKRLKETGTEIIAIKPGARSRSIHLSPQSNKADEYIAAAVWAREKHQQEPAATIGIIAPNVNAIRDDIEHSFASVFEPGRGLNPSPTRQGIYSVSLGKPLSSYPLVHTAMNLLSLGKRHVDLNTIGALLHSPFIQGAVSEQARRANFDSVLRHSGEQRFSFRSLYRIHERSCQEYAQCPSFIKRMQSFENYCLSHPKQQSLRQWVIHFSEGLKIVGWPGDRSLNSEEYQTITAWQNALTQLGSLDRLSKPVGFNVALSQLNSLLTETRFQAETRETPIQILGMTGAAGMQFDYVWILGMHDENWPTLEPADPFIPLALQREYRFPKADAESQLRLAKEMTQCLIDASGHSVFSYAMQEGDREYRISPLIKPYSGHELINPLTGYQDYKKIIFASAAVEYFTDKQAPAIPEREIAHGGSALFKDQAACPFRAFARHRLYAQSLSQADIGLSATGRGHLVHRALQFLWQELKTSETLENKTEAEIKKIIQSAVADTVNEQLVQRPEIFKEQFARLEKQRLQGLLEDWLLIERSRSGFKVMATESRHTVIFQGLEVHLRMDRVDELADGRCVIIDYKTGAVNNNSWESDRPTDPQLPLYAISSEKEVAAIAFACLKRGKLGFIGEAEDHDILPDVMVTPEPSWQQRMTQWEAVLITLANDFRQGKATVEPTKIACRHCDLHSLCRIYERTQHPGDIADDPYDDD